MGILLFIGIIGLIATIGLFVASKVNPEVGNIKGVFKYPFIVAVVSLLSWKLFF